MHGGPDIQDTGYTVCTCHRLVQCNDQGSQLDQLDDHLCHVVVKRDNLPLMHGSEIDLESCFCDQDDSCNVDQHVGKWI